jgi:hypothetical protein
MAASDLPSEDFRELSFTYLGSFSSHRLPCEHDQFIAQALPKCETYVSQEPVYDLDSIAMLVWIPFPKMSSQSAQLQRCCDSRWLDLLLESCLFLSKGTNFPIP